MHITPSIKPTNYCHLGYHEATMLHSTALSGYHLELFDAVTLDDNLNAHRINRDISKKNAVYTSVGKFQLSMAVIEGSQKD